MIQEKQTRCDLARGRRSSRSQTGNRDSRRGNSSRGVITFLEPEMQYVARRTWAATYVTASALAADVRSLS